MLGQEKEQDRGDTQRIIEEQEHAWALFDQWLQNNNNHGEKRKLMRQE